MTHNELNAALSLQRKIDRLQGRLDDLRQTGGVASPGTNEPVMGGSGGVCVGQIVIEQDQEITELKRQLEIEKVIIQRALDKLELEYVERKLMRLRYVECWGWKSIQKAIGYSRSQTYQYHSDVLEKIGPHRTLSDLKVACQ